ncbi:MAG: MBL fold metallo-hydrolase, partial [Chloroflexi bacterium]|nr:MBL fold metallo-hydrolase [Chloroflexota bacterium]
MSVELVVLGSAAGFPLPFPFCECTVCRAARADPALRRMRSSLAVLGQQTTLIDAGPDFEAQLERESIRRVDNILITHWHYDHIAGLGALGDMPMRAGWPPIHIYLPASVAYHYDQELAYTRHNVVLHPVAPGDTFILPDAHVEVVKTAHTSDSQGFIFNSGARWAYLGDGTLPPEASMARLRGLDLLFLEATVDDLDVPHFSNQSLAQAVALWQRIGAPRC